MPPSRWNTFSYPFSLSRAVDFSHRIPPVQNIAMGVFLFTFSFSSTHFGNSLKFVVLGLTAFSKLPIAISYVFRVSISIIFLLLMSLFQSLGLTLVPDFRASNFSIPRVTISFFTLTLSLRNGSSSQYEYFTLSGLSPSFSSILIRSFIFFSFPAIVPLIPSCAMRIVPLIFFFLHVLSIIFLYWFVFFIFLNLYRAATRNLFFEFFIWVCSP